MKIYEAEARKRFYAELAEKERLENLEKEENWNQVFLSFLTLRAGYCYLLSVRSVVVIVYHSFLGWIRAIRPWDL